MISLRFFGPERACRLADCETDKHYGGEKMRRLRFLFGGCRGAGGHLALAQTGSIQGTVTDSAGAVVQGAEVTVRNLGSNAVRTVTSSGTGAYSIPIASSRRLRNHGKDGELQDVPCHRCSDHGRPGAVRLNVQLEPGAVTEEVQVRADQIPDVDLETSQVSNLVDERAIKDLPLITRNPYELVLLVSRHLADQQRSGRRFR